MCIGIFRIINNINSSLVKELFKPRITSHSAREKRKVNLENPKSNQVRFGTKSLRYHGSKVRNYLSYHRKSSKIVTLTKSWNGTTFTCKICQMWNYAVSSLYLLISNLLYMYRFWHAHFEYKFTLSLNLH